MSDERPRWHAAITYDAVPAPFVVEVDFEEIAELHDIIERGPNWYTLRECVVTRPENEVVSQFEI